MISDLKLTGFRCFEELNINFCENINLITGNNGSGKTSILEALYLLGRGRSFRSSYLSDLIKKNQSQSFVFLKGHQNSSTLKIGCEINKSSLSLKINNEKITRRSILLDYLPLQIITPSSHQLVDSGPNHRRKFIDWGLFHVEQTYKLDWSHYKKTLKQRNKLLKDGVHDISHWNAEFVKYAESLNHKRVEYFSQLQPFFKEVQYSLFGESFASIDFFPGWDSSYSLFDELDKVKDKDRFRGWSTIGAHKADIKFYFTGSKRNTLSRGQQKILVFSLQLAQCLHLQSHHAVHPLLLIDDITSELDSYHINNLLSFISHLDLQCVMSAIDQDKLDLRYITNEFHVEQ